MAARSKEHAAWLSMRNRCKASSAKARHYASRGITVAPEWISFETFLRDVGPAPTPGHTLDRIDNDGPYAPGNVRWVTTREQTRNRTTTRRLILNGQSRSVAEWAEVTGIPATTLYARLSLGWPVDRVLTTPPKADRRRA